MTTTLKNRTEHLLVTLLVDALLRRRDVVADPTRCCRCPSWTNVALKAPTRGKFMASGSFPSDSIHA